MIRLRWFQVEPVSRLLAALAGVPTRNRNDRAAEDEWFEHSRVSKNRVESTFVEKVVVQNEFEDELGNINVFDRVEFRRTEFVVTTDFPQIQLRNSPRSRRNFLARLGEMSAYEVAIDPVRLDVMSTVSELERQIGRLTVKELTVSGYPLSARASAEIVVTGADDVRDDAARYTRHKYAIVKSASVFLRQRESTIPCEISLAGICLGEENVQVERLVRGSLVPEGIREL